MKWIARLANSAKTFVDPLDTQLPRTDGATARFEHKLSKGALQTPVEVICHFSDARYKKDRREFEKQIKRAEALLEKNESGRRAKFINKVESKESVFEINESLKAKTERLLGVKGYVTNIPRDELSDQEVVNYYHELWNVEKAFRMTKSDLRARPIFHYTEQAIRAHLIICFMGLMMSKYLEIKTGQSTRQTRSQLWRVHEARLLDERTGKTHVTRQIIG